MQWACPGAGKLWPPPLQRWQWQQRMKPPPTDPPAAQAQAQTGLLEPQMLADFMRMGITIEATQAVAAVIDESLAELARG